MKLAHAKIMQNQIVESGVVLSAGYLLIGMVIRGLCEVNAIKTVESISHLANFLRYLVVGILILACQIKIKS
jgi:hypothetical protein